MRFPTKPDARLISIFTVIVCIFVYFAVRTPDCQEVTRPTHGALGVSAHEAALFYPTTPPAGAAKAPAPAPGAVAGYAQPPSKQTVWFSLEALGGFQRVPLLSAPLAQPPATARHDKWIVVTSINAPTPTIEKLATLKDWRVVLVGDTKTPAGWAYPGITYLSVEAQVALGFSTTPLLRTRSYQRKNVGYLYAILHGARIIYETDDDNALQVAEVPSVPTTQQGGVGLAHMLQYASTSLTINHHAHFAQPSTWPRGYPLEAIGDPHVSDVQYASVIPAVQQGLANGDPDMDAVFRLTRKPRDTRVDFSFSQSPSIALPMGSFGPYNAQNTLFTYEGLWATVLPQTVEFRVCDIWRAYFTQRLLWGIGAQLTFVAPYVYQLRNSHSYHDDYVSEKQIFDQVTRLLGFLNAWKCTAEDRQSLKDATVTGAVSDLPACAYSLARAMAIGGFWGPADAELVRHFLHDLGRVGYVFPAWVEGLDGSRPRGACAAVGVGGECKSNSESVAETIDFSLPSISLHGTCSAISHV